MLLYRVYWHFEDLYNYSMGTGLYKASQIVIINDKRKKKNNCEENLFELQPSRNAVSSLQYTPLMLSEKSHSSNAISQSVLANQVDMENVKEL